MTDAELESYLVAIQGALEENNYLLTKLVAMLESECEREYEVVFRREELQ